MNISAAFIQWLKDEFNHDVLTIIQDDPQRIELPHITLLYTNTDFQHFNPTSLFHIVLSTVNTGDIKFLLGYLEATSFLIKLDLHDLVHLPTPSKLYYITYRETFEIFGFWKKGRCIHSIQCTF